VFYIYKRVLPSFIDILEPEDNGDQVGREYGGRLFGVK
jgi:hypothetical protein